MHFINVSFTHKNTDISTRERLSFGDDGRKKELLRLITSSENIAEAVVVSTCNRVEVFALSEDDKRAFSHIFSAIALLSGVSEVAHFGATYTDKNALFHLFCVASSLDSLVVGETQIAGQLKRDVKFAKTLGFSGEQTEHAVAFAFKCASSVRALSGFGKGGVSVASVAVLKAKEIAGSLFGVKTLVVGAGEMSNLVAKHLKSAGAQICVVNRSFEKASVLAGEVGGRAALWEELSNELTKAKFVFCATSAEKPVVTDENVGESEGERFFFDIAIPRDVALSKSGVEVFAVDDLACVVSENLALREEQVSEAYEIVKRSVDEFVAWQNSLVSTPSIKRLRQKAREVALRELEKAVKKGYIRHCDKDEAARLLHQAFKAFLHTPSVRLKQRNDKESLEALAFLFGLDTENG